jgi:integrase
MLCYTYTIVVVDIKRGRVARFGLGIAAALRAHKKRQLEERVRFGPSYEDTDQVFTSERGGPWYPWKSTHAFNALLKRVGLEGFRFHDLRHTSATLALLEGVPAKVVQEMLGHAKISQTIDTYSHVLPTMQAGAARKMDSALF